jgi:hypothetical protein
MLFINFAGKGTNKRVIIQIYTVFLSFLTVFPSFLLVSCSSDSKLEKAIY